MTQAAPTTPAGRTPPAGERPVGFASPRVAPLSSPDGAPAAETAPAGPPPNSYEVPQGAVVPLEQILPAPPESRDPAQPYLTDVPPIEQSSWRPDQPLTTNSVPLDEPATQVDPSKLPPPTGPAVRALPPPPGLPPRPAGTQLPTTNQVAAAPPGNYPTRPYPPNPYATGPYSYGQAPRPGQRPQLHEVLTAMHVWVIGLLITGLLWRDLSAWTLLGAAAASVVNRSAGRLIINMAAGVGAMITLLWFMGLVATSQWHTTTQLLSLACLVIVPLVTYQNLSRRRS